MRIAILTSNTGVERSELEAPLQAVRDAGWQVDLVASESGDIPTVEHDTEKAAVHAADLAVTEASPDDYDGLIIPGGTVNADTLRLDDNAMSFVRTYAADRKPIASICHGPWALVETGLTEGKTLTSWPSLRTDIMNAGGKWVDEKVFHCTNGDWDLVTSRKPDDLEAFNQTVLDVFGASEQS